MALLELEPPGPTLVAAYTQLAAAHFLTGAHGEAIAAADRACALAETLGLPEPARALGAPRQRPCLPRRPGRTRRDGTGAPHAHRAGRRQPSRHSPEQPRHRPLPAPGARPFARRLRAGDRLLRAARPNHLAETMEADCPGLLVELGRPEEALERAGALAAAVEASGATWVLIWLRALELATHLARGEAEGASGIADWLVEAARTQATTDATVEVLAAVAAARLAAGAPDQACALLAEIEQTPGARDVPYYSRQLGAMLRTALAAGDPDLARAARRRARTTLSSAASTPSAQPAPNSPNTPATTPTPQCSTPRQLHAGNSSETSASTPTRFSARAAVWSPVRTPRLSSHFGTRPICSARWATAPLSPRRKRSSSKRTRCPPRTGERSRAPTQPPYNGIKPVRPPNRPYGSVAVPLELARARSLHVR